MSLTHLNPATLHTNPAFSQGVRVDGGAFLIVGGQNGTDADGEIVSDDLGEQTVQAYRNVLAVLAEAGADQSHVAKLNIYLQAGGDVTAGYQAAAEVWGAYPTAITVLRSTASPGPRSSWRSTRSPSCRSHGSQGPDGSSDGWSN